MCNRRNRAKSALSKNKPKQLPGEKPEKQRKESKSQKPEKRHVKVRVPEVKSSTKLLQLQKGQKPPAHKEAEKSGKHRKSHAKLKPTDVHRGSSVPRQKNNVPTPLIRAKHHQQRNTSQNKDDHETITGASSKEENEHRRKHNSSESEGIEPPSNDQELRGHIDKIRDFIRRLVRSDIQKHRDIFDGMSGLLPRNATRHAFDANVRKCRFVDVICIDQSRVLVNSASNFIHASRVPITENGKNNIILTQLPMKNTVMDFWHMVWDENVQTVLAILTDGEWNAFGRRLKLLPKIDGCLHKPEGLCIVFQQQVVISPVWSVVCYGVSWNGVHRSIQWIQYNDWEHGQSPPETNTIWQIHSYLRRSTKPIVCMSLSGIGRAGSYAVLEMAHERIHNRRTKRLQLTDCVQNVRDSRMHALQSRSQFGFIQIALVDHLLASEKVRKDIGRDTLEKYQKLRQMHVHKDNGRNEVNSQVSRTSSTFL